MLGLALTILLFGAVTTTASAGHATAPPALSIDDQDYDSVIDETEAVGNNTVVAVEGDNNDTVVSGKLAKHGDPVGAVVREYSINALERTEEVRTNDGNVVTANGDNVIIEGGNVAQFNEDPDIRARYDNGTVEKLVVNGTNIETESGTNIETDRGDNIGLDPEAFDYHEFAVQIIETSDVGEGETMEISAEIGNRGHTTGEEMVSIEAGGLTYTPQMIELSPGESTIAEFEYRTRNMDAPSVEMTLTSSHDSHTIDAPIDEPDFRINVPSDSVSVAQGETVEIPVELDRTGGGRETTYAIDFYINETHIDTELAAIEGGGETEIEFEYETSESDSPNVTAKIIGPENTNATQDVIIRDSILAVENITTPDNISEHQPTQITAAIENFGTETKNQTVTLEVAENASTTVHTANETQVEIGNRSTENVTLVYHTTPAHHPEHQITVSTPDHEKTETVTTEPQPVFEFVDGPEGNLTAPPEEEHVLSTNIKNTGHANGSANITLFLDGSEEEIQQIDLTSGETESIDFSIATPSDGELEYELDSEDQTTNGTIITVQDGTDGGSNPSEQSENDGFGIPITTILTTAFVVLMTLFVVFVMVKN